MNVTRGLWRAWIFVTVLWVIGTAWAAYLALPSSIALKRHYMELMKWAAGKPPKESLTPVFSVVEWQQVFDWDKRANEGKLVSVRFPDNSVLYLNAEMPEADKSYIAAAFWDQRWKRYWEVALPYLYGGVGLPIALLLIGSFLVWVGRGFARDKPRLG